jgi:hypothetical protein
MNWFLVRYEDDEQLFVVKAENEKLAIAKAHEFCVKQQEEYGGFEEELLIIDNWSCYAVEDEPYTILE